MENKVSTGTARQMEQKQLQEFPDRGTVRGITNRSRDGFISDADRARLQDFLDRGGSHNLVD